MRTSKFRVWNEFTKKYETLQEVASRGAIMPRGNELKATVNYPLIIEQSTGLHDKNSVEIYEGDKCLFSRETGVIEWNDSDGMFCLNTEDVSFNFGDIDSTWIEVIGNIHDKENV